MVDFETEAEVEPTVTDRGVRRFRRELEDGLDAVDVTPSLADSRGAGRGRGRQSRRDLRTLANLADDRNAILRDILDELEDCCPGGGDDESSGPLPGIGGGGLGGIGGLITGALAGGAISLFGTAAATNLAGQGQPQPTVQPERQRGAQPETTPTQPTTQPTIEPDPQPDVTGQGTRRTPTRGEVPFTSDFFNLAAGFGAAGESILQLARRSEVTGGTPGGGGGGGTSIDIEDPSDVEDPRTRPEQREPVDIPIEETARFGLRAAPNAGAGSFGPTRPTTTAEDFRRGPTAGDVRSVNPLDVLGQTAANLGRGATEFAQERPAEAATVGGLGVLTALGGGAGLPAFLGAAGRAAPAAASTGGVATLAGGQGEASGRQRTTVNVGGVNATVDVSPRGGLSRESLKRELERELSDRLVQQILDQVEQQFNFSRG